MKIGFGYTPMENVAPDGLVRSIRDLRDGLYGDEVAEFRYKGRYFFR